jgi:FdhD protein
MIEGVTGVILAGGFSKRMGRDKARLPFRGKKLIDAPLETLSTLFERVVLSVRNADDFPEYSNTKIPDRYPAIGPLGGIASVLAAGFERIFCVACDMPFLNPALIHHLCTLADRDAVIPVWNGVPEVMHAIYSNKILPGLESAIASGKYKITDAIKSADLLYFPEVEIRKFDPDGRTFRNVNQPSDYETL